MPKRRVAIFGLGFSGIYAARAADDLGCDVTVYDYGRSIFAPYVSPAFWLSWVPADIALRVPATPIKLIPEGEESKYLKLKWGRVPTKAQTFKSDFPNEEKVIVGYEPEKVYNTMFPPRLKFRFQSPKNQEIYNLARKYDYAFQTFASEDSFKEQNQMLPYVVGTLFDSANSDNNRVWYNGRDFGYTVIRSELWGNTYFEFPRNLPLSEILRVLPEDAPAKMSFRILQGLNQFTRIYQPPSTAPDNLYFVGKHAEWNPYREYHQVYDLVKDILEGKI